MVWMHFANQHHSAQPDDFGIPARSYIYELQRRDVFPNEALKIINNSKRRLANCDNRARAIQHTAHLATHNNNTRLHRQQPIRAFDGACSADAISQSPVRPSQEL